MDAALLEMMRSGGRNKAWAETMVNLEARKLINTANRLSTLHLNDGFTRMQFVQEIKSVVDKQFAAARQAKSDEECLECVKQLRSETENLEEQRRLLLTKAAQLYAKVEFVRENNKIVGYMISAVHVALSSLSVVGGALMIATMTPVGILAGAVLVVDGANGVTKEFITNLSDVQTEGIIADGAMQAAKFMGFKPESGLAFYNTLTLSASVYSVWGLARKPAAWRLFKWMPRDYFRKIDTMSRPKLTMKIIGWGVTAKVTFDLLSVSDQSR
ncbi:DUF4225 domain-containing protein [Pantoea agglomerans]|uniref:DUF4225 domain-containing protein n=1 Tax=Enterobacter agglomerans TaxID=549 RepID=UPI001780C030|nr:DUF4225 domain-containing protein [Pantoea agglomerans]MBD8156047.1 DUF4225 domain-containing protein [Pantoea agglomerans]WRO92864.1 DUF4225 domain-containing protein [Pantoea agglomerans]